MDVVTYLVVFFHAIFLYTIKVYRDNKDYINNFNISYKNEYRYAWQGIASLSNRDTKITSDEIELIRIRDLIRESPYDVYNIIRYGQCNLRILIYAVVFVVLLITSLIIGTQFICENQEILKFVLLIIVPSITFLFELFLLLYLFNIEGKIKKIRDKYFAEIKL